MSAYGNTSILKHFLDIVQGALIAAQMEKIIASGNKSKHIIILKYLRAGFGRLFPLGLSHTENPALHIRNVNLMFTHRAYLL